MKILSLGEILWDVFEDGERLGGAPFNFAVNARRLGHDVLFVSAIGDDARGERALAAMDEHGLRRDFVRRVAGQPTGVVAVRLNAGGQPAFTIERPAAYDFAALGEADLAAISRWAPDWVYYGTLQQLSPGVRALTRRTIAACSGARRFYDVNLRLDSYTPELLSELMREASVLKLNEEEVPVLAGFCGAPVSPVDGFCRFCASKFGYSAVAVTLGDKGAALLIGGEFVEAPGYRVEVRDTVGAGDAFAAAFLHGLGNGWPAGEVADFANRVGALVASRPGAIPMWSAEEARVLFTAEAQSKQRKL